MVRRGGKSVGETFRESSSAIVLASTSSVAIIVVGLLAAFIRNKGPATSTDWTIILFACAIPWTVIALSTLHTATRRIEQTAPASNPLVDHYSNEKGQVAIPLEDIPNFLPEMPKIGDCYAIDVAWFIKRIIPTQDWTRRAWEGMPLPSGLTCDRDYHRNLMKVVSRAQIVIGYRPRAKGRLLCQSIHMAWIHLKIPQLLPDFHELITQFEKDVSMRKMYKLG